MFASFNQVVHKGQILFLSLYSLRTTACVWELGSQQIQFFIQKTGMLQVARVGHRNQ